MENVLERKQPADRKGLARLCAVHCCCDTACSVHMGLGNWLTPGTAQHINTPSASCLGFAGEAGRTGPHGEVS